jgi:hypothetical protein
VPYPKSFIRARFPAVVQPWLDLGEPTAKRLEGVTVTVFAFDIAADQIKHIWVIRNPEKPRTWTTG